MKIFEPYTARTDQRGLFLGITRENWIREINYVETKTGEVRGNHYHTGTMEMFFVIEGEVHVTVRHVRSDKTEERIFGKGEIFLIEPYEFHTFRVLSDTKWINMLSRPMAKDLPDLHPYDDDQSQRKGPQ
jgi:dTDP-4-dehydrorhamnose 3,5-epimerase-like enzyme